MAQVTSSTSAEPPIVTSPTHAKMVILIPCYEPDERLVALIGSILATAPDQRIVVVDDGSGPAYDPLFASASQLGCDVMSYRPNRGKGFALRTGFAEVERRYPGASVVCADCDGQHTIGDLLKVAAFLHDDESSAIVLGARQFDGDIPARSALGNSVTRILFRAVTGISVQDTQTGLRGYPAELLPWLQTVTGDRFEYELSVLLGAKDKGITLRETPIETVYLDENSSSHFRMVRDSIRVYAPLLKFSLSSLLACLVGRSGR